MESIAAAADFPEILGATLSAVRAFASPCCSDGVEEYVGHPTFIWTTELSDGELDELSNQWGCLWPSTHAEFYGASDREFAKSLGVDVSLEGDALREALRAARVQLLLSSGAIPTTLWIEAAREFEYVYGCTCGVNSSTRSYGGRLRIAENEGLLYLVPVECDLGDTLRRVEKAGLDARDSCIGTNAVQFERALRYRRIGSKVSKKDERDLRVTFALAQGSGDYSALSQFSAFHSPTHAAAQAREKILHFAGVAALSVVEARELDLHLLPVG
jgi:hypothetical protein